MAESLAKKSKPTKSSGSSVLPDIGTIGIEELVPLVKSENPETLKKQNSDLSEANFALNEFNNRLMLQLADKDKEIQHLKDLLVSSQGVPLITAEGIVQATPEAQLIELQLQKLFATAMTRELTLDETKRFDLYIKNKNLINERPTEIPGSAKKPAKEKSKQELLTTAARKTTQES